ncbi:GPW/gp25 family protein [Streptomyces parvus]|uniref:GPW/gp25 family protein n=1 Tax=Streptomyces parvus TaxID=66428 RepID=A0A7K3S8P5_9ACTN|nr:GPW/gp25 family protein [Streptomyces parvus]
MERDHIGTGWAFPLGAGGSGGIRTVSGRALLEQSMKLVLTTYPGERPVLPAFGSRLRDYVFAGTDPDTLDRLGREVSSSLAACEPRATVQAVRAEPDPLNPTLVNIVITYRPKGSNDPRNMVFPFYSLPDDVSDAAQDAGAE